MGSVCVGACYFSEEDYMSFPDKMTLERWISDSGGENNININVN